MISVQRVPPGSSDFQELITELDKELRERYQPYQSAYDEFNKVDDRASAVVAYRHGRPVGCGCFRPMADPTRAEIKRMFVIPAARRSGVARRILQELEKWAGEEGFFQLRLETGNKQPEAVVFYQKAGYRRVENYGPYRGLPTSVCMGKELDDGRES